MYIAHAKMQSVQRTWCVVTVVTVSITNIGYGAADQKRDSMRNVQAVTEEKKVRVLVYLDPRRAQAVEDRSQVKEIVRRAGGRVRYEYKHVLPHTVSVRGISADALQTLEEHPGVQGVVEDTYHPSLVLLEEATSLIRGLRSQLLAAGHGSTGSGVRVCICDTGIDTDHIMYAERIDMAASWDFANDDPNPEDDNGHGTHVAGIAVGGTDVTVTHDEACEVDVPFQGVAPEATLIGVKVLNANGGGYDSDIIAGIDHCADQSSTGGRADVINLSIGTGAFSGPCDHPWAAAANTAVANGVVLVAASGNDCRENALVSPACGEHVIAVGATYKSDYPNCGTDQATFAWGCCADSIPNQDAMACFSNKSDFLDVVAPGAVVWSASHSEGGTTFTGASGTSMAAPMVSGLAALILEAHPTLVPSEVRQLIQSGALDMGTDGFDRAYGYGRIDVLNTLDILGPCENASACDDAQFCNGMEICDQGTCAFGAPPCAAMLCNDSTASCLSKMHEWNLDVNPGWTMDEQWSWGEPLGSGGQHGGPDPVTGATGASVLGYNLAGDYANDLADVHLTSTAIDCSTLTNVTLRFKRWLGVERPTYDRATVSVSNDGTNWVTVWQNSDEISEMAWSDQVYDISSIADNAPSVYLRWTMGPTDGSWQYCGWNIDDIELWAIPSSGGCVAGMCDDDNACTNDECNNGVCMHAPVSCDDGDPCTVDTCSAVSGCSFQDLICEPGLQCDNGICIETLCNENGICETNEDCDNCAEDCITESITAGVCNNGVCEPNAGEDCMNCAEDCHGVTTGRPSNRFCCGSDIDCGALECSSGGWTCSDAPATSEEHCCGDGVCEGQETHVACARDCSMSYCGDGQCDNNENQCSCPADCGAATEQEHICGNGMDDDCDGLTDSEDPDCQCLPRGQSCDSDVQCCSLDCHNVKGECK